MKAKGSSGSASLSKSVSLPALPTKPGKRNPLSSQQPLFIVEVRKRRVFRESVGHKGSKALSQRKLAFVSAERGLEWERANVAAEIPQERLPPVEDVVKLAVGELGLKFPPKPGARGQQKHDPSFGGCGLHRSGPKLPLNRPQPPFVDYLPDVVVDPPEEVEETKTTSPWADRRSTVKQEQAAVQQQTEASEAKEAEPEDRSWEDEIPWSEDELRFVFQKFDADRDNELETDDLPALLRYLGAKPNSDEVRRLIREQTGYATIEWVEFIDFIRRYREFDINNLRQIFQAMDADGSGTLEFKEVKICLRKMGYAATVQTTMEAMEVIDKDSDGLVNFREFEALREHLRTTQGLMRADIAEIKSLFNKAAGGANKELDTTEVWRITMYQGYQTSKPEIEALVREVDADGSGAISLIELLIIIRRVREYETEQVVRLLNKYGKPKGHGLEIEDLGIALIELGYYVSEDAVFEILDSLGECESGNYLTREELAAFLRSYRMTEGFSAEQLDDFQKEFIKQDTDNTGSMNALELGRVLRAFGFARTLQATQRLVEEIDFDGSGMLEMSEFVKLMRQLLQGEAKKRHDVFELLDPGRTGKISVDSLKRAVQIIEEIKPDTDKIESACSAALEQGATTVSISGFEAFYKQYRRCIIEEIKKNANYSPKEILQLKSIFETYDKDKSGTIEIGELRQVIARYFPDATKSRKQQVEIQKLLTEFGVTNKSGELSYSDFLWLMRKCDDMRDATDVELEAEVVKEYRFSNDEVEGFRQIFSQSVNWTGELDFDALKELLQRVVELSDEKIEDLQKLVRDVHPEGREVARFPQFLRLVKKLTEDDALGVNDAAALLVRREAARKQRQLTDTLEKERKK